MNKNEHRQYDPASFRDPSGSVFVENDTIYRTVATSYQPHYEQATTSGLYDALIQDKLLVAHQDASTHSTDSTAWKIITPEKIPYISYPYEWCFSQLQDAALLTLTIAKRALQKDMILKDASAFNVQFKDGKPLFIDTLSFETYQSGMPWPGYRQFCEHFLAPLVLMSTIDLRLNQMLKLFLDGIPLRLTSSLLPWSTYFKPSILSHIHLHAMGQKKYEHAGKKINITITRQNLFALFDSLESFIRKLTPKKDNTEWSDYYQDTNYSDQSFVHKQKVVTSLLQTIQPKNVWDLGANDGTFSRIATAMDIPTLAFDIDPVAVEQNYRRAKKEDTAQLLPLVFDITNPSPGLGWAGNERKPLQQRGHADTLLALALIHHLAISHNVPFAMIAQQFSILCNTLVIEFVPKDDSQVQRLLATREDIFADYSQTHFETAFKKYFSIVRVTDIRDSKRKIYHMRRTS